MSKEFHEMFQKNERIEMFSDGVFAIVVTLLVLELKVPKLHDENNIQELIDALYRMRSSFISFVLSFLFVVMLWVAHNIWFRTLIKTDATVMWINNFFLPLVCFIPFPTALIGQYPYNPASMVLFGTDWMLIAVIMWIVGRYSFKAGFVSEYVDHKRYGEALTVMGFLLPLSILPVIIALYHPIVSLIIYLAMIIVGVVISFRIRLSDKVN